ncbi:hypothetical protein JCM10207_006202 [Rhodosporidiobolus poonsookiae]
MASSTAADPGRKVVRVVFFALVLDLLAFTMPLPLFPRLIEDFVRKEALDPSATSTLLSQTLHVVRSIRAYLFSFASSTAQARLATIPGQYDLTLLGGLLASLFSFCQFFISPFLGRVSDCYGRKTVLLATMVGNLVSAALWLMADSFGLYAASRIVGGLSEGNVQLSIACITDVTTPATRSKSLALVGIAFAFAFTLGPSIGAYFASRIFGRGSVVAVPSILASLPGMPSELRLNSYAVPAAITLVLLTVETIYLALRLPETRGWAKKVDEPAATGKDAEKAPQVARTPEQRLARLRRLERIHFAFLFFFAGAEFTLTFLTHNFFSFSNAQNGRLLGFVGVLSSLLQGGYVRRRSSTSSRTASLALSGVRTCALSLIALAALPYLATHDQTRGAKQALWAAAAGLAFVSATVVNSLNALASFETDPEPSSSSSPSSSAATPDPRLEKGAALGRFRSRGQLGRALGPLVTTAVYFTVSPTWAYGVCALGTLGVAAGLARVVREETAKEREVKKE